ncbi:MFS transporter [Allorhizocola rhizosphaerae]|uniref:MFS transporter n=1 Tax=Allorhizocola rhizosphaerae TaxID=1872709 RepID=UPI000E3D9413|nr:MFS transporter [Allorhizocola rhizosphaerae]
MATTDAATSAAQTERGPSSRWTGLAVISLAQLMVTLDSTIIAVALPSAQDEVGLTDVSRQWAVTAYALTFGGLLLLGGRIGDHMGRKWSLIIGVAGFAVASALGGAAGTAELLVAARALQGVFAALIAPATLSLISLTFLDPGERARAFGIFTATSMSGGATGLVLGGALTTLVDWRWCLYVNVPIALVILIGGWLTVPSTHGRHGARLDVPGAVLGTLGLLAVIYGLGEAGNLGWSSPIIIGALLVGVLLLASFVVVETKVSAPMLPLRVLTNRNSGGAFLAMAISAFCMLGMFLGMTYQLQSVMGYKAIQAGLAFLAYIVTAAIYSTRVAPKLLLRVRPGVMISSGLVISAIGLFLLTRLTPESTYLVDIFPALFLFGIGVGNIAVPIFSTAMSAADSRDAGIVSAVVSTSQQIGGSIGTALLNTVSTVTAAGYLLSHPGGTGAASAAMVHGLTVACAVAGGVALVGAIAARLLIDIDPRKKQTVSS